MQAQNNLLRYCTKHVFANVVLTETFIHNGEEYQKKNVNEAVNLETGEIIRMETNAICYVELPF